MIIYKKSKYYTITDSINVNGIEKKILYSTRSGKILHLDSVVANNFIENRLDQIPSYELEKLKEDLFVINNSINELSEVLKENIEINQQNKNLYFVIQPSSYCQLGCSYCGQTHKKDRLTNELSDKILDRISSKIKPKYNNLSITWYGAEALTGLNQIKYLSPKIQKLAIDKKLKYNSEMITNGLGLKKEICQKLISEYNIRHFKITLDGLANTHNKSRPTKKGANTFDIILNNIIAINDLSDFFTLTIRTNINIHNASEVFSLIDLLASHNLQKRVLLEFIPIVDWGENKASKDSFKPKDFSDLQIKLFLHSLENGFKFNSFIPKRRGEPCMATNIDYEVFDTDGNIFPCYEFPLTESHNKSENLINNFFDNNEDNKDAKLREWNKTFMNEEYWCKNCNFLPVCGGSCPKSWHENIPPCPPFKYNMEERLILDQFIE